MFVLIAAVLLGLGFAYIAIQNTAQVTLQIGSFLLSSVPLYFALLGSFLCGLIICAIISLSEWASNTLALRGKESTIKEASKKINDLENKVRSLEIENARLQGKEKDFIIFDNPKKERPRGFFEKLKLSRSL